MNIPLLSCMILSLFSLIAAHDEDIHTVKYSSDDFAEEVPKKHHFVMFYAPWCGHCQRLGPTWEQLAEMLNEDDSNIKIAKVDCTTDSKVCSEQAVTGYPTLKFFKTGDSEGVKFRGTRDLPSLTNFINEQLRQGDEESSEVNSIIQPQHGLVELTEQNFHRTTVNGKHFVEFYAPWCGHCQRLAPIWEELAKNMEFNENIGIEKIDCTQYKSICNDFDVKGYPTLLWIENGKKMDKYQGERTLDELKQYVSKMSGGTNGNSNSLLTNTVEVANNPVGELTGDNFQRSIESGTTFVKFFAPWCGHCKRLAPTWEDLGKKFSSKQAVKIAKVDCTQDNNKQLCNDEEIEGFPSLFLYKNGKKVDEYSGSRTLEDMTSFLDSRVEKHDEL